MNDRDIEDLLNNRDFDFSGDDDDEYLPPEVAGPLQQSQEVEEDEEEVQTENDVVVDSSRLFWRTKDMTCQGPNIADDILIAQGTSNMNILYSFFEYLGARLLGTSGRTH